MVWRAASALEVAEKQSNVAKRVDSSPLVIKYRMGTSASVFERIIYEALQKSQGRCNIAAFYGNVERTVKLDKEDLIRTVANGKVNAEPSWKRNLRNKLQQLKGTGRLVNDEHESWRLPSPDPTTELDQRQAWALVREAATVAMARIDRWTSPASGHEYSVREVNPNSIVLKPYDSAYLVTLSKDEVERSVLYLNSAGGKLGRTTINVRAAKECAFVYLHPSVDWSKDLKHIEVISLKMREESPATQNNDEAANDDPAARQAYSRKVRKGQPKLRKRLLELYQGQCCISRTGPNNVLQAAHIEPHALKGLNSSSNGLLLRSDLHDLFDDGLVAIDPDTLTVWIHASLRKTSYAEFEGRKLKKRSDGTQPSIVKLRQRWLQREVDALAATDL